MWAVVLKALGFFLLSTVKFAVAAVPIALAFPFEQAWLISVSGGMFGGFFFIYLWAKVLRIWHFFISKNTNATASKVHFNSKKRRVVKIKRSYGYWGIIILTPSILSIPLGAFILVNYYKKRRFVFWHLSLSIALWATLIISFLQIFGPF